MDDPALSAEHHRRALDGLARLNALSGVARSLWRPIAGLPEEVEPVRILDLATGGGDVPIRLWRRARRAGRSVGIRGLDLSPTAIQYARDRAAKAGAAVKFQTFDVLQDELPEGFDVVCCSLFLHHLDRREVVVLLEKMRRTAGRMVLVSDLVRSRRGWVLAWTATRLFTASEVVRTDSLRSVRAAFTPGELRSMVHEAGMNGAQVKIIWPSRMLLIWKR